MTKAVLAALVLSLVVEAPPAQASHQSVSVATYSGVPGKWTQTGSTCTHTLAAPSWCANNNYYVNVQAHVGWLSSFPGTAYIHVEPIAANCGGGSAATFNDGRTVSSVISQGGAIDRFGAFACEYRMGAPVRFVITTSRTNPNCICVLYDSHGVELPEAAVEALLGADVASGLAGDPVNTATGNFLSEATDLLWGSGDRGLDVHRGYNSRDTRLGVFGRGWSSLLDVRAVEWVGVAMDVRLQDGRLARFSPESGGYSRPEGVAARLVAAGAGWELRWVSGEVWVFDPAGWLVEVRQPGHVLTVQRDQAGVPLALVSSSGRSVTFTVGPNGVISAAEASDGRTIAYGFDGDLLTSVGLPDGRSWAYGHDASGRMSQLTGPDGVVEAVNTFDVEGRVVQQVLPSGESLDFAYAPPVTTVTWSQSGDVVVYEHDERGRLVSVTDEGGLTTVRSYDADGNLIGATDRSGSALAASYDGLGLPTQMTRPDGASEMWSHDGDGRMLSWTDAAGGTSTFSYTGDGVVPSTVTDQAGQTTGISLDAAGRVASVTDADGVTTTLGYDQTTGDLVSVTDALGNATSYAYDAAGRVTGTTSPLGHTSSYGYDVVGRLTSATDPTGAATLYRYDGAGRLLESEDPTGAVTAFTYHLDTGTLASVTDPLGHVTTYEKDGFGRRTATVHPDSTRRSTVYGILSRVASVTDEADEAAAFGYDLDGNRTTITDPLAAVTTTSFGPAGRVDAISDPLGRTTAFGYDTAGRLAATTAPDGAVSATGYDVVGRVTQSTDPLGHSTVYAYTPAGRLAQLTDPAGQTVVFGYDAAGRPTGTTFPDGTVAQTVHDADGRVIETVSRTGLSTTYTHDAAGRLVTTVEPGGVTTTRTWTDRGELATITSPAGITQSYRYDAAGQLVEAVDGLGGTTTITFNARGWRTERTDQRGQVETFSHDPVGRSTGGSDPLGRATQRTYDAAGRLVAAIDASGRTLTYAYDAAGQLTSVTADDGRKVIYGYDAAGRRTTMTDPTGSTTWSYDTAGRVTQVARPGGLTVGYRWDGAGRRVGLVLPDGTDITYTYDTAGWPSQVVAELPASPGRPAQVSIGYSYDADGRLLAETLPGGASRAYDYTDGRLTGFTQAVGGVTTTSTLTRDPAGRISALTTNGQTTSYGYDAAGQLTSVLAPAGTTASYSYGPGGYRTGVTEPDATTTNSHDAAGQLTRSTRTTTSAGLLGPIIGTTRTDYSHDGAGRRTRRQVGSTVTDSGYDRFGRLATTTRRELGGSATTSTRFYDGDGRLTRVSTSGQQAVHRGFMWDDQLPVAQLLRFGGTWLIPGPDGRPALAIRSGRVDALAHDVFGSTVRTTATTDLAPFTGFDAWGNPVDGPTGVGVGGLGYRGELHVDGLVHLRARDYDPATATFTSRDPLDGWPGRTTVANPYHYGHNDPLAYIDPSGLTPTTDTQFELCGDAAFERNVIDAGGTWAARTAAFTQDAVQCGSPATRQLLAGPVALAQAAAAPDAHLLLAVAGMAPGHLGIIADGVDSLLYVAQGDFGNAALAVGAVVGIAGGLSRWGGKATGGTVSPPHLPNNAPRTPTGNAYSVAYEVELPGAALGRSRGVHFNRANTALDDALQADASFGAAFDDLIPGASSSVSSAGGRANPSGWTWHHVPSSAAQGRTGVMQLVPSWQHAPGSMWQQLLHPGGVGGYAEWAVPRGARR